MTPNPLPAPPTKKSSPVSLIFVLLMVPLVGCCGIGVLAAIAVPNFIRYQARAKQTECKVQLTHYAISQRAYREAHDGYALMAKELKWEPASPTRYLYLAGGEEFAPTAPNTEKRGLLEQVPADIRLGVGGDAEEFLAACAGNIDDDPALDVWTVSSNPREFPNGVTAPAFVPFNDQNDLTTP